jgi:predicted RNA binding protein YcfA (HicA-like mRNA interferase family)
MLHQDRQKGSHVLFIHSNLQRRVVVPVHHGDIPKGTLNAILKKAGLKR